MESPNVNLFVSFSDDTVWDAAKRGDLEVVRKFVERDGIPNADNEYESLLTISCAAGHVDVVRYLLELEAASEEPRTEYAHAASAALDYGRVDVIRLLCEFGLDPSASRHKHDCGLFFNAVERKQVEITRLLLAQGAELDVYYDEETTKEEWRTKQYPSEIERAARAGDVSYVEFLLEVGVDLGGKDAEHYLTCARQNVGKWEERLMEERGWELQPAEESSSSSSDVAETVLLSIGLLLLIGIFFYGIFRIVHDVIVWLGLWSSPFITLFVVCVMWLLFRFNKLFSESPSAF